MNINAPTVLLVFALLFLVTSPWSLTGDFSETITNSQTESMNLPIGTNTLVGIYDLDELLGTVFSVSLQNSITTDNAPVKLTYTTQDGTIIGSRTKYVGGGDYGVSTSLNADGILNAYMNTRQVRIYVRSECLNDLYSAQCSSLPISTQGLSIIYDAYVQDVTETVNANLPGSDELASNHPTDSDSSVTSTMTMSFKNMLIKLNDWVRGLFR